MSFRTSLGRVPEESTLRCYIRSAELSAKKLAETDRQYWYVKYKLHWTVDVALWADAAGNSAWVGVGHFEPLHHKAASDAVK